MKKYFYEYLICPLSSVYAPDKIRGKNWTFSLFLIDWKNASAKLLSFTSIFTKVFTHYWSFKVKIKVINVILGVYSNPPRIWYNIIILLLICRSSFYRKPPRGGRFDSGGQFDQASQVVNSNVADLQSLLELKVKDYLILKNTLIFCFVFCRLDLRPRKRNNLLPDRILEGTKDN